ncbi:tyrosine-type recombinase/integrase [Actinomadura xylanilytica]|uniref:tyrosine-type recombinase/integrase n=1 Tax=Actinomadura xylanilytica TaxID=887459 RepID=UPI00255A76B6|nr:site-specific integrase [Actinomadura xylanilytica]MDL4770752.1 site-specific integrase [Actinomadura xylanilytica]
MGYSFKRVNGKGKPRYTACYEDLKGRIASAGTFSSKKEADKAWQRAEAEAGKGRDLNLKRGRQTFRKYVEETWLPNHEVEPTTMQSYHYSIYKHVMPEFGSMRMMDILPEHIRVWIKCMKQAGVSPATIRYNKVVLSAIFSTALNDQVTYIHPCKGVRTPTVPVKPLEIINPDQFDELYRALPDADAKLLVETAIETGLRWGELTELRAGDLKVKARILTVSRVVVELNPKFHPEGRRFLVKDYPKDKEWRRFKLSTQIADKLQEHFDSAKLGRDDLLFVYRPDTPSKRHPYIDAVTETLGWTEENEKGHRYRHGTLSAYNAAKCRCTHCRQAVAAYRAHRRAGGKDQPRQPRIRDTDGHIPANWFRNQIWKPALQQADLDIEVRIHDLRHAHASWLLAGGADLQVVKERLGHGSISTTERYLHTLDDADDTALNAFNKIRSRERSKN